MPNKTQNPISKYNGIILIGPLGAGKDFVLSRIRSAFEAAYVDSFVWQVGDYYYKHLSNELNISVAEIYKNKPIYRSRLQEIGSTKSIVEKGVNYSINRYIELNKLDITPIVIGRLPNEASALQNLGACLIYIEAPEHDRIKRVFDRDGKIPTDAQMNHPVEPTLVKFQGTANCILHNGEVSKIQSVDYSNGLLTFTNKVPVLSRSIAI